MAGQDDDLDDLLNSTLDELEHIDKTHAAPTPANVRPTPTHLASPTPARHTPTATTSITSIPNTTSATEPAKSDEELADQFAKQMTDLMKSFQTGDFEKNIEELAKSMGLNATGEDTGSDGGSSRGSSRSSSRSRSSGATNSDTGGVGSSSTSNEEGDLSAILSAFATLDSASANATSVDNVGDITNTLKKIAENAKNLGDKQEGGEEFEKMLQDFESNPEFQSVMEGMVNQMISKDVLYEPMKELREKYPKWLADKHPTLSEEEYAKYIKQYDIVQKICCVYESPNGGTEQMMEVVQLMQEMAEYGQPPQDIIKELAPGVQIGPDGVPIFPGAEEGDSNNTGCSIM